MEEKENVRDQFCETKLSRYCVQLISWKKISIEFHVFVMLKHLSNKYWRIFYFLCSLYNYCILFFFFSFKLKANKYASINQSVLDLYLSYVYWYVIKKTLNILYLEGPLLTSSSSMVVTSSSFFSFNFCSPDGLTTFSFWGTLSFWVDSFKKTFFSFLVGG